MAGTLRWAIAAGLVLAVHAGAAWLALPWSHAISVQDEAPAALIIELAASAVAPLEEVTPSEATPSAEPPPSPENPELPRPEPARTEANPARPQPDVAAPDAEIPQLTPQDKAEATLDAAPKRPLRQKPDVTPLKQPAVRRKPPTRSASPPPSRPASALPPSERRMADLSAAPQPGVSSAPSVSPAQWKSLLMAQLNRHKRFPAGAAGAGTTTVEFTLSRTGEVTAARITRSSGDPALDQEAVALLHRASPVPPPPASVAPTGTIALTVPVRFNR